MLFISAICSSLPKYCSGADLRAITKSQQICNQNVIMTIRELNHVAIYVTDVKRSSEFYRDVLRLEPIPRPAFSFPGAWFRLGSSQELHLIADHGAAFFRSNENNHFALRVDDLDAWERHLKNVGADFAPRKRRPDGAWQVFLRDPDGHVIELFTPPG